MESPNSVLETDRDEVGLSQPPQREMPSEADEIKVSSDEDDLDNEPDDQSNSIGSEKLANLVQKEAQGG